MQIFEKFDAAELVEAGFHQFVYDAIKKEQVSGTSVGCADPWIMVLDDQQ